MRLFVGLAVIGSVLFLAGVAWLAAAAKTLLRSLEETEENTSPTHAMNGRTRNRMQIFWTRSAFAEMAEWKADMGGNEAGLVKEKTAIPSRRP